MTTDSLRVQTTHRMALTAITLGCVGLLFDWTFQLTVVRWIAPMHIAAVCGCAAMLAILVTRRSTPNEHLANAFYLVNNVLILEALASSDMHLMAMGRPVPFMAQKLGVMTIALLAPPRLWVGAVSILGFTLVPVMEIASMPPIARAEVAIHEPWATIAFGGFAVGALVHSMRRYRLERQAIEAHARAVAMARFAERLVAVKDLMRSPVQNLVLILDLLREGRIGDPALLPRFERAVARLVELSGCLDRYERDIEGQPTREHFDALELLTAAEGSASVP